MLLGVVKWFDPQKGFGILASPGEGECFLHINAFRDAPENILKGASLVFEKKVDDIKQKKTAIKCRFLERNSDWKLILSYLTKGDSVSLEVTVNGTSRFGNPFKYKEDRIFSLMDLSVKQLFKSKSDQDIFSMITTYFEEDLLPIFFVDYCVFIEKSVRATLPAERTNKLLVQVFHHFGQNLNSEILFWVWKKKVFKYIDRNDALDYEIPEAILLDFVDEIGFAELKRIKTYDYGVKFCLEYLHIKLNGVNSLSSDDITSMYPLLGLLEDESSKTFNQIFDKHLTRQILKEINLEAEKFDPISSEFDFRQYESLRNLIPTRIKGAALVEVQEAINALIIKNSTEEFKTDLWLKGLLSETSHENICKAFFSEPSNLQKRIQILSKLEIAARLELLNTYSAIADSNSLYSLLKGLGTKALELVNEKTYQTNINLTARKFSFLESDCILKVRFLYNPNSLDKSLLETLKERFVGEQDVISGGILIDIFRQLKEYKLIPNEDSLLNLLEKKSLNYEELAELIGVLHNPIDDDSFRTILKFNNDGVLSRQKTELILRANNFFIANVIIDELVKVDESCSAYELDWILQIFLKNEDHKSSHYFLDKFHHLLCLKFPFIIFDFAFIVGHQNAQKIAFANLSFTNEEGIIKFLKKAEGLVIDSIVMQANKPLSAFLNLFKTQSEFRFSEDCRKFFNLNTGIVQLIAVKFLISKYYEKKLTRQSLLDILNSFAWTEISALLIHVFIQESTYTEKILLDKLNSVFKAHFEILSMRPFSRQTFIDNFSIKNILNLCNGRKYYSGRIWNGNGGNRWYVNGQPTMSVVETLSCYCEGRPWKKEIFWDSDTNKPLPEPFDKYWCKTNYCAQRNDDINMEKSFYDWTISEIGLALNITVEKLALSTLAGWVNRMNTIVSHLICRECNEVLRPFPFKPNLLGHYAVPTFHCINPECKDSQVIRFTHCLNGKCESHKTSAPLDSRDCESCRPSEQNHTGLKCNYCGTVCPRCTGTYTPVTLQQAW